MTVGFWCETTRYQPMYFSIIPVHVGCYSICFRLKSKHVQKKNKLKSKMGKKDKKEKRRSEGAEEGEEEKTDKVSWEDKIRYLSPISQPLASKKLAKKLCKTVKKGYSSIYLSSFES